MTVGQEQSGNSRRNDTLRGWFITVERDQPPGKPRLRLAWRLLGHLGVLALLLIPVSLPVAIAQLLNLLTDETLLLAGQAASAVAITGSVFLSRRWLDRRSLGSLGLGGNRISNWLAGFGIAAAGLGTIFLLSLAAGWLEVQGFAWQAQAPTHLLRSTLVMLVTFLLTGWTEELWMRGYLLVNLTDGLGLRPAILLSSLVFALLHGLNPGFTPAAGLGLLAAGLLFAFARLRSGSLWLPVSLHAGWNFIEDTVLDFPVSGLNTPSLLVQGASRGPAWITGGAFGPEAGLILLPGLLVMAILIYYFCRPDPQRSEGVPKQTIEGANV